MGNRFSIATLALWGLLLHVWAVMLAAHLGGVWWSITAALTPALSWLAVIWIGATKYQSVALFGLCAAFWALCVGFSVMASRMSKRGKR